MVVCGLELVNLCETRKWNTQFHRKISNGKTGLPFQKFHFFRKFSSGTNRKIMFHLQPNRNFRNLLVNGKHLRFSLLRRGSSIRYINPLCEVYRRHKVEWIDQAENLCQMYVDFSYILVVFSYIDGFLGFG